MVEKVSGAVGNLVFRRYEDEVVVGRKPDVSGVVETPAQAAHRERFRLAAVYGKGVFADPETKAIYEKGAKARGKPAFALAVADFLNEPVIDSIDLSAYTGQAGESIGISVHDDFEVVGVAVAIRSADGAILEHGPAAKRPDGTWRYSTTTALVAGQGVVIEVTASDRPGHKTVKTQAKP